MTAEDDNDQDYYDQWDSSDDSSQGSSDGESVKALSLDQNRDLGRPGPERDKVIDELPLQLSTANSR